MIVMLVALGGGIGAVARWSIVKAVPPPESGFPFAITIVNVVGSFVLGFVIGTTSRANVLVSGEPLTVGVLGGFTTFSTWMVDIEASQTRRMATRIIALPMALGLAAAAVGLWVGSAVAS